MKPKRFLLILAGLLVLPLFAGAQVKISPGARISTGSGIGGGGWNITSTDPIEIRWKGEIVTVYQTGKNLPKPFFYPLIGPTGENVTRHWPMKEGVKGEETDHKHHRSVWFGLGNVNGIDFWHEGNPKRPNGKMVHTGMKTFQQHGDRIAFTVTTDWLAVDDNLKICQDTREFGLQRRPDGGLILDASFTIEASKGDVKIGDDKEGAFAIRVMPSLRLEGDHARGAIINSNGEKGREAWAKRADWVDFFGPDTKGNPIGIALFDHPSNLRHPSWWHARYYGLFAVNPFGEGHFDSKAEKNAGDYTIKHGDSLTLKYRVLVHPGTPEEAGVAEAYQAFAGK